MLRSEAIRISIAIFLGGLVFFGLPLLSRAQDPGIQDSMIIGNFDRTPMLAGLNMQITVPVYLRTDDSVIFIHVPVATDTDFVATRSGGVFFPPLSLWDDKSFLSPPDPNSPIAGYTNQSFLGFAYLVDPRDPQNFLYTHNTWVHIADFRMTTTNRIDILGQTTQFVMGINPANGDLVMGLQDGISEVRPAVIWGSIYFPPNNPPIFVSPDTGTFPVNEQFGATFIVTANDPDTDSMVLTVAFGPTNYTFTQFQNVPGRISFRFNWVPGPGESGTYPLSFIVNDGNGGVIERNLTLVVTPAGLSIGNMTTLPGSTISIPVLLNNPGSSSAVGGFEILVTWNPEALTLSGVTRAGRLGSFEYFHINYNDAGAGTARILGIADVRNGNISPPLHPGTGPIFFLEMAVAPDEALIGVDLPVNFLVLDPSDNTLSDSTGYLLVHPELTNGEITIIGPDDVLTGDINLDGTPYTISDIVLFVNHLTFPLLFPFDPVQMEASDVNADGLPSTVADLVYLINIANGNIERPKLEPDNGVVNLIASAENGNTVFHANSPADLGGILMKISHEIGQPLIPISNGQFTLSYNDDGTTLIILAYLPRGGKIPAGNVPLFTLATSRDKLTIDELSASDANGYLINALYSLESSIPNDYELTQNYPNPFNASTRISFGLPEASDIHLDVYNITGQKVATLADGRYDAGRYNIVWNSIDNTGKAISSGVYFYRLETGKDTKSMKMTLLK
jgi:hypothetical protein